MRGAPTGIHDLVGRVAVAHLKDGLAGTAESGGTARFLLDGLSVAQTVAIARAVLDDPQLSERVEIRLPISLFSDSGLPERALTHRNATFYRSAHCDRDAFLTTNATPPEEEAEEMSLQEVTPLGVAQLLERIPAWVQEASQGLGLTDDARLWWERALAGLAQLAIASLDRFAGYVLAVRRANEADGHPLVDALGAALPELQMPRDPSAFAGVKERARRFPSTWRREYAALRKRRRPFLLKETQNQILLNEDDLAAAFEKVREGIPETLHPTITSFIAAPPGWNGAAQALAECEWEQVKPLFEGLSRDKLNLGGETLKFFQEGEPDLLSADDLEYLRLLKDRTPSEPREQDVAFHDDHRDEIRENRRLKSAWDKFIFGRPRETHDFLAGLAAAMETLLARASAGGMRTMRIRCDQATKRELRSLNTDAGLHFAFRYAGLPSLFGSRVHWEVGSLLDFPLVVMEWRRTKDKGAANRSVAKAALQLRFQIELETGGPAGGSSSASAQLIWKYRPDAVSSQLADDWERLEANPFLMGRAAREPAYAGRRAGAVDLGDVRSLVPAYDRDRGSLLPTYRRERDAAEIWTRNLETAVAGDLMARASADALAVRFARFRADYEEAIRGFRVHGAGARANRQQAASYAALLDAVVDTAAGDTNRELLLRPLLEIGQATVDDGSPAAIVAPWHPLRLAAMWRKAKLVAQVVQIVLDGADRSAGDTKLFFRDLAADLDHPFYPEVTLTWAGRRPELLAHASHSADYSLHERPVAGAMAAGDATEDAGGGGSTLLDLVGRYLALNPHERSNMSVVLYNCDSARLPQEVVAGLGDLQDETDDLRCQVMLRNTEAPRLRDIYRAILATGDGGVDTFSASEATQDFMARLRISVIADQAPPPDPRDGRPYDIVFSQDVISRHAVVEWYSVSATPADLETLLPARWSRRRPAAADDLKSTVYLCCPVQSAEGWAHIRAVTSFVRHEAQDDGRRLLPVRQLDFRDDRTARIFEETHDLGVWVVNHDELLDRRQLQNQSVRVIRYKQAAAQGRNVVISSRAPLNLLRAMIVRRLEALHLDLPKGEVDALAEKLIRDANDVSGDIVLRAAKRGESASELIGIVLSRFLAHRAIGADQLVGWYFLDDYAAWLGAREETQADILALAPSLADDGRLRLRILVTEAKYVEADSLSAKRKESEKQLRDTVRRVRDAVHGADRLDRESWLSRLGDLLLDGIQVSASSQVPLGEWRRAVREGDCDIAISGVSHVFVPTPIDGRSIAEVAGVPNAPDCMQEVYGRAELKSLLLAYLRDADPEPIRLAMGAEKPAAATMGAMAEPAAVQLGGGEPVEEVGREPEPHVGTPAPAPGRAPIGAAEPDGASTPLAAPPADESAVVAAIDRLISVAPIEADADEAWLSEVAVAARSALQQLGMQAKPLAQTLTPNAAILRFAGSANLTVEQVLRKRSELLTTHGLNAISVRPEPGAVAIYIARPRRRMVTIESVWDRWRPSPSRDGNQDLVVGVREEDNSLLTFSPGKAHAPHTLIAGSTGSGKSVLMQSIILGIAATNSPRQARIVLIDPKQGVDYFAFDDLPHLEGGIIDDQKQAIARLEALVIEMDRRYSLFKAARVANLAAYNVKVGPAERLPAYWVVHDEFAEWMLTEEYRASVTATVGRLGVKARAAGIYLIFAAQRPDANVVPVQLRSQLGNRLILKVDSEGTSEIALGERGAERLLGRGHMLSRLEGEADLVYAQAPFASEAFIDEVVAAIRAEHAGTREQ